MSYLYNYTKTPVSLDRLSQEIRDNQSITKALDYINFTDPNQLDVYFKEELPSEQITSLTITVTGHSGQPLPDNVVSKVTLDGIEKAPTEKALKIVPTKLEGSSTMFCSPNFCDKTTWYGGSTRVSSETLSASGGYNVYTSAHSYWIDISHGKIPYEDRIDATGNVYKPHIFINDVETTTGFTIDYTNGVVTFTSSQEGNTIKATYSYSENMEWIIAPTSGKVLKLIGTEIKFTKDCVLNNCTITFQPCVSGNAYGSPTIYKNMADIVKCCMGVGWIIPSFDDLYHDIICLPFDYVTSKDLKYSQGASVKITLSSSDPISGTFATCIGYCISLSE